MDLTSYANVQA
jgi:ATP-binding cassette, subfamily A (ABC1), member 3